MNEYVIFRLADESYGVKIDYVENIEKLINITRVPYTKGYIQGIINLRGIIIPVINVRKRFSLDDKIADKDSRIMIVNYRDLKVGLLVDASSEVLQIEDEAIEVSPKVSGVEDEYIKEIAKDNGRIVMIVDLDRLLELEEIEEI